MLSRKLAIRIREINLFFTISIACLERYILAKILILVKIILTKMQIGEFDEKTRSERRTTNPEGMHKDLA